MNAVHDIIYISILQGKLQSIIRKAMLKTTVAINQIMFYIICKFEGRQLRGLNNAGLEKLATTTIK